MADSFEAIAKAPQGMRGENKTGSQRGDGAARRKKSAAAHLVEEERKRQTDQEIDHRVLREKPEADCDAEQGCVRQVLLVAQACQRIKACAPEHEERCIRRNDRG